MARELLPLIRETLEGRYVVDREIGRGGAARVFAATTAEGKPVALKVLHPQLAATVTADRFLREIGFVARLEHPRIARLLDSGEGNWLVWYVMEYVDGPSLRQHLDRARRISIPDTVHIAGDLLGALGVAHAQAIVHRDVKPDNIILARDGAVLVDFGIAKAVAEAGSDRLTRSGFTVGTSAYMSPEQVAGVAEVDARSDLYSVGCVLFECLAGRPPFSDRLEERVLSQHQNVPAPDIREFRAETPPSLAAVLARALAKPLEDRWPTAAAMADAVAAAGSA